MPSASLTFRATCGQFVSIFQHFMSKRLKSQIAIKVLKIRACVDGAVIGLLLSLLCFGNLLFLCGDVELNPGPPKNSNSRQTRLTSEGKTKRADTDNTQSETSSSAQSTTSEPTLRDLMDLLCSINSSWSQPYDSSKPEEKSKPESTASATDVPKTEKAPTEDLISLVSDMNNKFEEIKMNLKKLTNMCAKIQNEMTDLKREMNNLKDEHENLQKENAALNEKVENFERKTDYLETQSKRNNVIFHGMVRKENETSVECERSVRKLLTDKLQLTEDIQLDKVHRLNNKDDSPVVVSFTYFHQKKTVLRLRHKLQGTNIFISLDLPSRIRDIRRKLLPFLKEAKRMNKKAFLVYDHLIIDGKKHYYDNCGLKSVMNV